MANGVMVCQCGRVHWNNGSAIKELFDLIRLGHIQTTAAYLNYKRMAEGYISPALARKRIRTLHRAGLVKVDEDGELSLTDSAKTALSISYPVASPDASRSTSDSH